MHGIKRTDDDNPRQGMTTSDYYYRHVVRDARTSDPNPRQGNNYVKLRRVGLRFRNSTDDRNPQQESFAEMVLEGAYRHVRGAFGARLRSVHLRRSLP